MSYGILSNTKKTKVAPFWKFNFDTTSIEILSHKKAPNVREIIYSLSILGPSNTADIVDYVLKVTPDTDFGYDDSGGSVPPPKKARFCRDYNRLINKRREKVKGKGKKIIVKEFDGLISHGYVVMVGKKENKKGKLIPHYFLTLKGIFLTLGFEYNHDGLEKIIENFSKVSLYFALINTIMRKTTVELVKEVFIDPLRSIIKKSNIFQGEDLRFYFSNITEYTSHALTQKMKSAEEERIKKIKKRPISYYQKKITKKDFKEFPSARIIDLIAVKIREEEFDYNNMIKVFKKKGIETIINSLLYYEKPKSDWYDSLIEYYYKKEDQEGFYRDFGYYHEEDLVYKVMRGLHFTYYQNLGMRIPRTPRKKLRRSKFLKRHLKWKNNLELTWKDFQQKKKQ